MKKPTFFKAALVVLMILLHFGSYAQTYKPFSVRKKIEIRGKMIVAGNNILGQDKMLPCNDNKLANQDIEMKYINIDNGATTGIFSSSSADLVVPKQTDGSATSCYKVAYAALYWGAMLQSTNRTGIDKVKLKLPGATTYNDIAGKVIYDAIVAPIIPDANTPYACYADVTDLLGSLSDLNGTYTVANVIASQGKNGSTGLSAGWTLFVVYEDPSLHMKSFNVFDGFGHVYKSHQEIIPVTGFRTPPSGNVNLQFAYAALDGDKPQSATKLLIAGKEVTTPLRSPANVFFSSTIENTNGVSTPRNPLGTNTLGYDTGVLEIEDVEKGYVKNSQTSTDFALQVAPGQADPVFAFFAAFAVDIIAPKIDLTKIVKDATGTDIGGANVNLGQYLTYEISYRNVGNDDVKNFTIKDVLPVNVTFNPDTDIDYSNAGGATLQSYDVATKTLVFKISDASVKIDGGLYTIRLKVRVATDCNSLVTACSNEIKNQAFATYQGVINTTVVKDEGSFASTSCNLGLPESTNFLVDISKCTFTQKVILCGSSAVLKASDGYSSYSWSKSLDGSNPIGTGQTYTATQTGTYYVHNSAPATCKDIVEEITVSFFGATNTNPVIPYAQSPYRGEVVICTNNAKPLPNLFLCGANDTRLIKTGISDATSIVWEKLDEVACPSTAPANCANENFANTCWKEVGSGPDYLANTAGQFRVTLKYAGGCQSTFYFNVYQNLLAPTFTKEDIVCNSPGNITIGDVPSGYEYSLDGIDYQDSPKFSIDTPNNYTVHIRQKIAAQFLCDFTVPNIQIYKRDLAVDTFITQPSCTGDKGFIKLVANNVDPQYFFTISQGTTIFGSVGPIATNEYTSPALSPGLYNVTVSTKDDNCLYTDIVEIIAPPLLKVTASLSKALTCVDGEITINVQGGTANYNYYVNDVEVLLNTPLTSITVPIATAGTYNIKVIDVSNCEATDAITVAAIPKPEYTVSKTDVKCYGTNSGEIKFDVTNNNGYTLSYGISTDNGVNYTYGINPTISNLAAGEYYVILKYSLDGSDCLGTPEKITITAPSTALTASAGVASLAGCTLSGDGGLLRITNVQGGIGGYEYSFDGGASWQTSNEKEVLPGTYVLKVRDQGGCEYTIPYSIILDEKPTAPTITVDYSAFNCDGTATATVTVTNEGGANYEYEYLIDGNPNPNTADPKVFLNLASGSYTITVNYKLVSVPTYSNLLFEDFGSGPDVTSPGINTFYYKWERQVLATQQNGSIKLNDGEYTVTAKIVSPHGTWLNPVDHTTGTAVNKGRYLAVNIGDQIPTSAILYQKEIKDIIRNQPINVKIAAINLLMSGRNGANPNIQLALVDLAGNDVSSVATGAIPKSNKWEDYLLTLNPGDNTNLKFVVRSNVQEVDGNDVAIDDIEVYQLPESCITEVEFPITVPTDKAFTATVSGTDLTCATSDDGTITIAAQNFNTTSGFQYSIDGGTNWEISLVSPAIVKDLVAATYDIQVRYNNLGDCTLPLGTIEIKAPTPVTVLATVTKEPTCTTGATITASAAGGTPAYEYELRESDGVIIVKAFSNNNGIFTDVPTGDYLVYARDAKLCISAVGAPVSVIAPIPPTATLDPTVSLCYDGINKVKLIVNVSGGVAPYSYAISPNVGANAAPNQNTFDVLPGSYSITVTDANGCIDEIKDINIAPTLRVKVESVGELRCETPKDATIKVTVSGGTAPYKYTVNGGTALDLAIAGTISYEANTSGDYIFLITDAKNCTVTKKATVAAISNPTLTINRTHISCNGLNNGSVVLTGSDGSGGYTYSDNATTGFSPVATFSNLTAGTHTFFVKDSKGCIGQNDVVINEPTLITGSAAIEENYTCSTTATIKAIASGGTGTLTFELKKDGASVTSNTTGEFKNLSEPGVYEVVITDTKGCLITESAGTILALNPPKNITFSERKISCKTGEEASDVTVSVTAGTGTPALKYEITAPASAVSNTTGASTGFFTGLTAGTNGTTYTFKVTDANDCFVTGTYKVLPVVPIVVNASLVSNVKCNGDLNGAVEYTISGLGNNVNYSYSIDGGTAVTGTTPDAPAVTTFVVSSTSLSAGLHSLVITDLNSECTSTNTPVRVDEPVEFKFEAPVITPITCLGKGKVVVNTSGGWGNRLYTLTQPDGTVVGPQSNSTFGNLTQTGTYDISVTDLNGNGCTVIGSFDLDPTPQPAASIDLAASDLCYDAVGKATIVVKPAAVSPTYMYNINDGVYQSSGTFLNLNPGRYVVKVKDTDTGCILTLDEQYIYDELKFSTVLSKGAKCFPAQNTEIKGTVSGGKLDYSYTVSVNGGTASAPIAVTGTTFIYTDPIAANADIDATYVFTLTDAASPGCSLTSTVIVGKKTDPEFTATPNSTILCNGASTGSIVVVIDPATGASPYVINVFNTTTSTDYFTKNTGLPAGYYTVRVTDAKGCFTEQLGIEITEPTPILVEYEVDPITCVANGVSLGKITILSVDGGTKNYTYHVRGINYDQEFTNKDGSSQFFEIVNFGYYEIIVTDANGCSKIIKDILVTSPPDDLDITVVSPPVDCSVGGSAIVAVGPAITGGGITGDGPFYFAIYDGSVPNYPNPVGTFAWLPEDNPGTPGDKKATFTDLTPGVKYTFIIYDSDAAHGGTGTGCYYFETSEQEIPTNSKLKVEELQANNITCFTTPGSPDGNVSFKISSEYLVPTDVDYQIFNQLTLEPIGPVQSGIVPAASSPISTLDISNFGALPFGNYIIVITEVTDRVAVPNVKGCSIASIPFNITGSVTPLTLTVSSPTNDNCGIDQGIVEAFGQGGTTIAEDLAATLPIAAVPYLYQIFEDFGAPGIIDPTDVAPTAASFTVTSHTSNTFNKEAGHYIVYVRDAYGCIQHEFVEVLEDPAPTITAVVNDICAAEGSFVIDVINTTIGGGIAPFSYSLDGADFVPNAAMSFSYSNLSSGDHKVAVKDFNGCTFEVIVPTILAPLDIKASFTTMPTCLITDGVITAVVTGGSGAANYEFTLVNNTTSATAGPQATGVFSSREAGSYTITVKDLTTSCTQSNTVDLIVPTQVDVITTDIVTTAVDCSGTQGTNNNGTLTVNLRGVNDNPDYSYTLTPLAPLTGPPITQLNDNVFTGLSAGDYSVVVTSGRGCESVPVAANVPAPPAVYATATAAPFSCVGDPTKTTVELVASGGTGDYMFSKDGVNYFPSNSSPADDKYTFMVDDNGSVQNPTYYIQDQYGCVFETNLVTPLDPLPKLIAIDATLGTPIDCVNNQQKINVVITGGSNTPNGFSYQVYEDGVAIGGLEPLIPGTNNFTYNAVNAAGHSYEFEVFDINTSCSLISSSIDVPLFDKMRVVASASSMVDCNGNSTGAIKINIVDYAGPYTYEILQGGVSLVPAVTGPGDSSVTSSLILDPVLAAGTDYTVKVLQTAYPSCEVISNPVIITEPDPIDPLSIVISNINQNCTTLGAAVTIDVPQIIGGTPGYTYAFVEDNDSPIGKYTPVYSVILDPTVNTEWDVYVMDSNGCFIKKDITIAIDESPKDLSANAFSQCPSPTGTYTFTVSATTVSGLVQYSIGAGFQPSGTFTVDQPGVYHVTVRDKNGCINPVPFQVPILDPLQLGIKEITEPKCNDPKGIVTLEATGGSGVANYQYKLGSTGTYGPSNIFPNLTPGIAYTFFVQDTGTPDLCEAEVTITIPLATAITLFEATPTAVTCKGGSDGVIEVTMETPAVGVNDNPIYTFVLTGKDVLGNPLPPKGPQESTIFSGLVAGEYTVTVTSGRGCEAQETAVVDEPDLIVVPAPVVDGFGCTTGNSLNFATISVDPNAITGGSTDYVNYEFIKGTTQVYFGPNSQYTEYDLLGGTYIVNVYDDKGCMGSTTASVTIDPYIRLESADVTVTAAITCLDGESIRVNVTTNGGTPAVLDYAISDAAGNAVAGNPNNQDGIFTALPIGNYIITVSNPDTGCSIQTVHYVNNPNTFVLKAVKTSDVICYNSNEGTVELTLIDNQTNPDDEAGPFSYVLTRPDGTTDNGNSPDKGPFTLTGLTAGLYSVTATLVNSPFCSASSSFTIVQPAAVLDITETNTAITCVAGNNDGSISVSATGGLSGGYEFEVLKDGNPFIGYTTQTEFTGLTAGIYRINVKDSKGCVDFVEVELKNPDPIIFTATLSAAVVSCFGDTSENIEVATLPTGGSGSYLYTLISTFANGTVTSNGPQISPIFPNLGAGDYVVKVTDSWNCSAVSATFTISEPTKVVASLVVKTTQTCNDLTVLELSATGGTPPYTYSADGTFTATGSVVTSGSFASSTTFSVPVGTYHYYVRDANGCTSYISNDIKIDPLEPLEANLDVQNAVVNCKGDASGVIVAHANGGLGNYVYTLLDGAGNAIVPAPVQSSPGRFDGLIAGFYQVKVESGDCEMISGIVEIKEPLTGLTSTNVVTDVTCNGENNGKIEINASGGTGQIKYAISPRLDQFFDSGVFDELVPGVYQVVIQDENGCFIVQDFEIKEPSLLSVSTVADSVFPEICAGDKDGAFSIEITGGTAPYSVSLGDINGTYTTGDLTQTEFDFTGLSGGNHFVFIRDANGCTTDWLVALPESINMNPIAIVDYGCVNNAAANTVTIMIDDSITNPADVDYALDGGNFQASSVFTNLVPGFHYVTARHSNGCEQQTINFEIKQVEPLTLVLNDGGLNEIVAVAAGGGGNYKYTLNGESYSNKSNFIIYKSGNYTVTVTDGNGCVASATRYFEYIDVCIPNNFTPNGDGINDVWAPGCTVNYKDLTFEVFDRYGRKVGNYRLGQYWDGRYNGTELPSGDYWYVLKLNDVKDAREFVGHFTLYR